MACSHKIVDCVAHISVKRREICMHALEGKQCAVVFDRVMRTAHYSVPVSAAVSRQNDRHAVQADVIPNLFESSRI